MWNWIKRKNKHFIFIGILLPYLLLAHPLYNKFFIKNGKPESAIFQLPETTPGIVYNLVELRPVVYEGESLYELKGFAFLATYPTQVNRITIILTTASQNLAFSTSAVPFPDMIESYPGYRPGMEQAEFSMALSNQVLKPGVYRIGVLLEDMEGFDRSYVLTGSSIKKTPNTISFIPGP